MSDSPANTRIEHLVRRCLDLPPAEREAFIEKVAGHDEALQTALFERVAAVVAPEYDSDELPPDPPSESRRQPPDIPRFRIRREIGRGAASVVHLAEQLKPIRRDVALKLMKRSLLDDARLRGRFESDREGLARMDHPALARVFDAGLTHDGKPWFAMEYVEGGKTLLEYVRGHALSDRARLEVFAAICEAVHHGHEQGVIHGGLEPRNVLVDRDGNPKVIGFGAARLVDGVGAPLVPPAGSAHLGGVEYLAPERQTPDPPPGDVRGDVFALGVIGYELMTDHLPFATRGRTIPEIQRAIRDGEPAPIGKHRKDLGRDLVAVITRAIAKDPADRYPSVHELGADVRRLLAGEPVGLRRAGPLEDAKGFARKHPAAASGIVAIVLLSIAAAIVF
jgi:serine/threonine protein kinase